MSKEEIGVVCEVDVFDGKFSTRSAGPHRFLSTPRVGETLVAEFLGEDVKLRVREVLHIGMSIDSIPQQIKPLNVVEIHLTCEKI